ncbi:hypothetical protein [Streptacidiphilus sp. MAP5-3]|uniref:hypothetical protein n=1 Tax=unclassified Streptacidiphilus TaxID=2643834 RepID=UPI0035173F66
MNESRTKAGTDTGTTHTARHVLSPRTRRRAGVAAAVLLTAGLAAATALLPSPAQAQERTGVPSTHATTAITMQV